MTQQTPKPIGDPNFFENLKNGKPQPKVGK
jgi:hypothetical protein